MRDLQVIADRVEIEALRGEHVDAAMVGDYDRFASLFTEDAVWRIPPADIEFTGRKEIRAGIERLQDAWEFWVQNVHPGTIHLEGDTATGRESIFELGRQRDGRSVVMYGLFHDRYQRTPDGWKFAERVLDPRYLDTTALTGSTHVTWNAADPEAGNTSLAEGAR
ncbi:nuclear transport factor 2 family protein [Nonomuraea longispora]|uniref:Nuclear transport factor 2 family protein n=1 Tax=Nonomuraea longispora TaxID=1848320 RepID=A0A4R4MLU3_9ACTN|nr:nuclear transport factor 2 family protein [Nonomuraea longispora]TDB95152.1 nuclear transport factor 2 family protein [Nonomuraea longispora]